MSSIQKFEQLKTEKQTDTQLVIEDGIIKGVEINRIFNYESIGELILEFLNRKPEHVTEIDGVTGRKVTRKELRERSIRLAIWMEKEGIETGDIISVSSPDHQDIGIIILASLFVGATYAPFRQVMNFESARKTINHLKPRVIFTCSDNMGYLQKAARMENHVWQMIALSADNLGHLSLNQILELQTDEEVLQFQLKSKINPSTICTLSTTSGTTGTPKFVCHTYEAIKMWILAFCNLDENEAQNDVALKYLYPEWSAHFAYGLKYLLDGCTQIFHAEVNPRETFMIIEKYKVNTMTMTTYWISLLCQENTTNEYEFDSVTYILPQGSKLYPAIEKNLRKMFPNAVIDKGYGSTETYDLTSTVTGCLNPESVGIVFPKVQLKIVDVKSGATLGPRQTGAICAKTSYMMVGYYKDPVTTKLAVDDDGWFNTGDLGFYEENGEIFIEGRSKEMIRFRHADIHPSYVEKILLSHPNIVDAAVVGIHHDVDLERPVAFIQVAQDSSVTEEDILKLTSELEYNDTFQDSIIFIDKIPRSTNGKIKRIVLRERAEEVYAHRRKHL